MRVVGVRRGYWGPVLFCLAGDQDLPCGAVVLVATPTGPVPARVVVTADQILAHRLPPSLPRVSGPVDPLVLFHPASVPSGPSAGRPASAQQEPGRAAQQAGQERDQSQRPER